MSNTHLNDRPRHTPASYTGMQNFHKYWGKKPSDLMALVINTLSRPGDVVLDPFVGYGAIARECISSGREFLGIDINPVAVRLTKFLCNLPRSEDIRIAQSEIQKACQQSIEKTYVVSSHADYLVATHYLWTGSNLTEIWTKGGRNRRITHKPTEADIERVKFYSNYRSSQLRPIKLFDNSRINSRIDLTISSFFSGRALHNIDILLSYINSLSESTVKEALLLCVTSSLGQMSKMVFAITQRGKTTGKKSKKIEVGSWVIGYWRPHTHFEINVWNCFFRRLNKLVQTCATIEKCSPRNDKFVWKSPNLFVGDCIMSLKSLDSHSIDLVITDPPHGDRIPYLELSELWNARTWRRTEIRGRNCNLQR